MPYVFKNKKHKDKVQLYIPMTKEAVFRKLQEALYREGKSLSAWFFEQAEDWLRVHGVGNPQAALSRYVGVPLGPSVPQCGKAGAISGGRIYCNKDTLWLPFPRRCLKCWRGKWVHRRG